MTEFGIVHGLCDGGRTAHIHKQHGQFDLRAAGELGCEKMTASAIPGVLNRAQCNGSAYQMQERTANAREVRMAVHAARIRWEHPEEMTPLFRPDIAFGEVLVPHLINGVDLVPPSKFFS